MISVTVFRTGLQTGWPDRAGPARTVQRKSFSEVVSVLKRDLESLPGYSEEHECSRSSLPCGRATVPAGSSICGIDIAGFPLQRYKSLAFSAAFGKALSDAGNQA